MMQIVLNALPTDSRDQPRSSCLSCSGIKGGYKVVQKLVPSQLSRHVSQFAVKLGFFVD